MTTSTQSTSTHLAKAKQAFAKGYYTASDVVVNHTGDLSKTTFETISLSPTVTFQLDSASQRVLHFSFRDSAKDTVSQTGLYSIHYGKVPSMEDILTDFELVKLKHAAWKRAEAAFEHIGANAK